MTVTAGRPGATSPAVMAPSRTVGEVHSSPRQPAESGRTARAVALATAFLVMFSVLFLGLQRLAGGFTAPDAGESTPSLPSAAPAATQTPSAVPGPSGSNVASATGSLAPTDPAAPVTTPTTTPSSTFDNPENWPEVLPDLGEHRLLQHSTGAEERWLLAVPGGPQLSGGRFLAGLERLGWKVDAVSTVNTVTAIGSLGPSRVSATVRPGGDLVPEGWGVLEVVYLERVPDFEPPTTTPPPSDEETARKRS
jgi:hypothetical protein